MPYKDRAKQNAFNLRSMKARREAWLSENGPCVQCSSWLELQVHHRDKATKVSHNVWSWRQERRIEELAKCDVLCKKCHTELHALERRKEHGSKGYRRGCRCPICRAYKSASSQHRARALRAKKRFRSTSDSALPS